MSFLTAEWRKLALANYIVEPEVFTPYLPKGTEIDLWNGNCYASLVGFMFTNVRLLGVPVPFHTQFEEVNLRFYVRHQHEGEWRRGVVFIKEIVPKAAITIVANTIYQEHYQTLPMRHQWQESEKERQVAYSWRVGNQWQEMRLSAEKEAQAIAPGSETEFITEHYWGYTRVNEHTTFEYQVTHPTWEHYPVLKYEANVDFELTYGTPFSFLNELEPASVMLAEGSAITVEAKNKLSK